MRNIQRAQEVFWDVVILGAGASGMTIAHRLAKGGKKVLLVDRNDLGDQPVDVGIYAEQRFDTRAYDAKQIEASLKRGGRGHEPMLDAVAEQIFVPFIGSGAGGSTRIYGSVLQRFAEEDFHPRRKLAGTPADLPGLLARQL
jgi:choline dehydrogenase-like flavoprotein